MTGEIFKMKINLRTYRQYKNSVEMITYVKVSISRLERRTIALFRADSLPLAYETGRCSRPPVPFDERLCLACDKWPIKSERNPFFWNVRYI